MRNSASLFYATQPILWRRRVIPISDVDAVWDDRLRLKDLGFWVFTFATVEGFRFTTRSTGRFLQNGRFDKPI
jgi:hypothetical protein